MDICNYSRRSKFITVKFYHLNVAHAAMNVPMQVKLFDFFTNAATSISSGLIFHTRHLACANASAPLY